MNNNTIVEQFQDHSSPAWEQCSSEQQQEKKKKWHLSFVSFMQTSWLTERKWSSTICKVTAPSQATASLSTDKRRCTFGCVTTKGETQTHHTGTNWTAACTLVSSNILVTYMVTYKHMWSLIMSSCMGYQRKWLSSMQIAVTVIAPPVTWPLKCQST